MTWARWAEAVAGTIVAVSMARRTKGDALRELARYLGMALVVREQRKTIASMLPFNPESVTLTAGRQVGITLQVPEPAQSKLSSGQPTGPE
jgi:hypothetical protein